MNTRTALNVILLAAAFVAAPALATPVSYVAELNTSSRKPVTNVLILEQDQLGTVHAAFHGSALAGNGRVEISHNPPYTPQRTLIIGLTDGLTPEGDEKTQIIVFMNPAFAASLDGVKWSDAFRGSSHNATIASLIAAGAGNATELAWFTGAFFRQIAAPAVFSTAGSFVIGEFSVFTPIGIAEPARPVPALDGLALAALILLLATMGALWIRRSRADRQGL
jgi:hypothetical protein